MAQLLAFDIELADALDLKPGEDLDALGPFSISCAAVVGGGGLLRHWHGVDAHGQLGGHLSAVGARELLLFLEQAQGRGDRVVAWNGLSFDLKWLGYAAEDLVLARRVAMELYDPMFQFFVQRGFPVGLGAVAAAMGVGEQKLMDGAEAPLAWKRGEFQRVLDYVAGDCRITKSVAEAIERQRRVLWRTKRGTVSSEPMAELLPVRALLDHPEPDVSWMSDPLPRDKFTGWLEQ